MDEALSAPPARNVSEIQSRLSAFDRRHSRRGRLLAYIDGRRNYFRFRQLVNFFGFCVLSLAGMPLLGLLCSIIAATAEGAEVWALRRLAIAVRAGMDVRRGEKISLVLGLVQAVGISLSITLAGLSAPPLDAAVYCFSYHGGAIVMAGVGGRKAPMQVAGRIAVHIAAMAGLLLYDLFARNADPGHFYFDGTGMLLMLLWLWLVVEYLIGLDRQQEKAGRSILEAQHATERVNADLRRQQETLRRMSLVARHARDGLIITDEYGTMLWVNQAFCEMTGYSAQEVVGQPAAELLMRTDSEAPELAGLREAIVRREPFRGVFAQYRKSGELTWIDKNVVPIAGPDGQIEYALSVDRDVTEDRAKARELAEAKARAERGERAKTEFLATMSHEIRTPMHGIIAMSELLSQTALDSDQALYARTIRSSADALLTIINDILDLSKLDSGKLEIAPERFQPRDCLREVVELLRPQAAAKGLRLEMEFAPEVPQAAIGDAGRLRQILMNLLGNAIKFTREGSVRLTVRALPAPPETGASGDRSTELRLEVRDSGIGIPTDRLEAIFEPFQQAEGGVTTRSFGGTGLGLTISRLLARRMGGDITVTSTPGEGSCFSLRLTLAPAPPDTMENEDRPEGASATPASSALPAGLRVLVAEDNATNRLILDKFLRDTPARVTFATNGAEALEAHLAEPAQVVLMDMAMPVMDGLEATRRIRASDTPQPHIVALTANAFDTDRDTCLSAGMDDFLTKPVRRAELLARLAAVAERAADVPTAPG